MTSSLKTIYRQWRSLEKVKGAYAWRSLYFFVYYFFWVFLRWGDRHARALKWLKRSGLADREVSITTPDGNHLALDLFTAQSILSDIYNEHVYEPSAEFLPPSGGVVVDAGGQMGVYAAFAARRVGPNGHVVVFEAHPQNARRLEENMDANHFIQVRVLSEALGDHTGTVDLHVHPFAGNHSFYFESMAGERLSVLMRRLDDVWPELGLPRWDVFKIDVEGSEVDVLRGARASIAAYRPRIMIETDTERQPTVEQLLRDWGYRVDARKGYVYAIC